MNPIKVFISYSHKDELLKKELEKHLNILKRNNQIEVWHDRKIGAGSELNNTIDDNLKTSQIILLLISSDFIDSDYCYEIEMKEALKLHEEKRSVVVPIILRECSWHKALFGKLTALPTDGKPIIGKEWFDKDEAFTDVEKGIENIIEDLQSNLEQESSALTKIENMDSKTLHEAIELYNIESQKLSYNSSKEDFKKFEKLKRELYIHLFEDIDKKIESTPRLREKQPEELFDTIWTSENLDQLTIQKIQKIREDKKTYPWYERIVVISAISLSLLSHKNFDQKKANLLIDFLTDFEENVWENALTGLILALVYYKNKWDRFGDLKRRLEMLKNIDKVQDGLYKIESILRSNLYQSSLFHPHIYLNDFFNSPANCFLPFFENNPILESYINNAGPEVDIDKFIKGVMEFPFLNCFKYYSCLIDDNDKTRINKRKKDDIDTVELIINNFNLSSIFNPYQNIICDFFNFLKFYPKEKLENVLLSELSIAKTKLKDIVFNRTNQLKVMAALKMDQENYADAISHLLDLLKIVPDDQDAHWNISNCYTYLKTPNYEEALHHLKKLEGYGDKILNINTLIKIADIYLTLKSFNKSIEYFNKAKLIDPKNEEVYLGMSSCYDGLKQLDDNIAILTIGEKLLPKSYKIKLDIACHFMDKKEPNLAIEYVNQAIAMSPKEELAKPYRLLAMNYEDLDEFDVALKFALKAYKIDPKHTQTLCILGRIYFTGKIDIGLASIYLEKSLKDQKEAVAYGNLGHIDLCKKNFYGARQNYLKCITTIDNENEFVEKFNIDLKYIIKYGITEKEYLQTRDQVVNEWKTINKR